MIKAEDFQKATTLVNDGLSVLGAKIVFRRPAIGAFENGPNEQKYETIRTTSRHRLCKDSAFH